MDFFDYNLAGSSTPPQRAAGSDEVAEPSLNEEVSQVVGQLGKLWGGFRKQVGKHNDYSSPYVCRLMTC